MNATGTPIEIGVPDKVCAGDNSITTDEKVDDAIILPEVNATGTPIENDVPDKVCDGDGSINTDEKVDDAIIPEIERMADVIKEKPEEDSVSKDFPTILRQQMLIDNNLFSNNTSTDNI